MRNLVLFFPIIGLLFMSQAQSEKNKPEAENLEKATFAGGCFWCMEPPYDKLKGVKATISGYTGGTKKNPTYEEVAAGLTDHAEAVQVHYDPKEISFDELLNVFWMNIDPTTEDAQFVDHGRQYRTGIFYNSEEQKKLAEASKEKLGNSGRFDKPIVTEITPLAEFYPAEEYHQDYYKKSPFRYKLYRAGSGRDRFIEKVWGDKK